MAKRCVQHSSMPSHKPISPHAVTCVPVAVKGAATMAQSDNLAGSIRYCRLTHHHVTTIVSQHLGQQHIVTDLLHPSSLRTLPE
jgi:hypothetical protein